MEGQRSASQMILRKDSTSLSPEEFDDIVVDILRIAIKEYKKNPSNA